jgi:hypothetical protein
VQLAQVNLARLRRPLDAPETAGFVAALAPLNALADAAPGFVWRLADDGGDATAIRVADDPLVIVNLTVWTSLEALRAFVYAGAHRDVLRRRREWFAPWPGRFQACWWVADGTRPTPAEGLARVARLERDGAGPQAFDLARPYAPDGRPCGEEPVLRARGA